MDAVVTFEGPDAEHMNKRGASSAFLDGDQYAAAALIAPPTHTRLRPSRVALSAKNLGHVSTDAVIQCPNSRALKRAPSASQPPVPSVKPLGELA